MRLDIEAVAHRYADRPGYRFVAYRGVGIAVFVMDLRVLSLESRLVPPIQEFLIKLLMEGIESLSVLSNLLGLEQDVVRNNLIELRRQEVIDILSDDGLNEVRCGLTSKGKQVAQSLHQEVMQEITIPNVIFHGILRQPVDMGGQARRQYLRPIEARDLELELIRAIPNRHPYPSEIDVDKLDRIVRQVHRSKTDYSRDIIAVRSVLKNVRALYEPAVMLEYETIDQRERIISFAVEGRLRNDYEDSFLRSRGPELLVDLITPKEDSIVDRVQRQVSPNVLHQLGRIDDVELLAAKAVAAEQEVEDTEQQLKQLDRADTREKQRKRISELEQSLAISLSNQKEIEKERDSRKVQYLWTPDIRKLLWEAIKTARYRLLIFSGFISSEVVNKAMEEGLRQALKRGVNIWIGYGLDGESRRGKEQRQSITWKQAEATLARLQTESPDRLVFRDIGRNHEKRLICDNQYTFGGSFNLLSFSGERRGNSKVRHEGADLIENQEYCEELWKYYIEEFFS